MILFFLLYKFKLTGLNYSDFAVFKSRYTNAEDAQTLSDVTTDKEEEEVYDRKQPENRIN